MALQYSTDVQYLKYSNFFFGFNLVRPDCVRVVPRDQLSEWTPLHLHLFNRVVMVGGGKVFIEFHCSFLMLIRR